MRHHSWPFGLLAMSCGLLAGATSAQAAAATWVSATGTDAGTCPITAPCRTFGYAHSQTSNKGAINVLSSGNYGPVTITKPISIVAQGVEAVINTATNGAGIVVQAGASAIVSLRGLTIDMRGTPNIGVSFVSGGTLRVRDSFIRKATDGIKFSPAAGTSKLSVSDTILAKNANASIYIVPTGAAGARAILDRVRVEDGGRGIFLSGTSTTGEIFATVRDTVAAGNSLEGMLAEETGDGNILVMVDRSGFLNNSTGVHAKGATIRMGDSTVSGNATGLVTSNIGVMISYTTNKVDGNGSNGAQSATIVMQ